MASVRFDNSRTFNAHSGIVKIGNEYSDKAEFVTFNNSCRICLSYFMIILSKYLIIKLITTQFTSSFDRELILS